MTPHYADDWLTVYHGDSRAVMAELPPESVHCVVTSPPYWGLRDYAQDGQLGLEPTPEAYVANMVDVFREVRRVLRSDGTVWLNLGDSYAGGGGFSPDAASNRNGAKQTTMRGAPGAKGVPVTAGLKPKDLVGIPWRVAFALQADGWYLRSDIIWSKPNPMPESVTDRPTKSHEYLFLLSKSPRYYFDADAVRETAEYGRREWSNGREAYDVNGMERASASVTGGDPSAGRNIRSVWTIATAPYRGAHFATFPPKLVEPCIKAGTSERGVCPECGAPWVRIVERGRELDHETYRDGKTMDGPYAAQHAIRSGVLPTSITTGWFPTCDRYGHLIHTGTDGRVLRPVPATICDPFAGSGTTGMVAQSLSRRAVLIDLSMDYLGQLMERNKEVPLGL